MDLKKKNIDRVQEFGKRQKGSAIFFLALLLHVCPSLASAFAPGTIFTVAGTGVSGYSGDGGAATSADLHGPSEVAVDGSGNLFIADFKNNRVRKVVPGTGVIMTIAGDGTGGYSGDGAAATSAELYNPIGVAVDVTGDVFIADYNNERIREVVAATGIITTIAGDGTGAYNGDGGAATSAELYYPVGVAVDVSGDVFIGDTGNNRVREIVAGTVTITTVAGNGTPNFSGDGAAATSAELWYPQGVVVDSSGNLIIADSGNQRIRKVAVGTGIITTLAGDDSIGAYGGDGAAATLAELNYPTGVAMDSLGNLFIADQTNQRVRKIAVGTGIITTVAGDGTYGYSGDGGPAAGAELFNPAGVAVDSSGNLFIADYANQLVRMVYHSGSAWHLSAPGTNIHDPAGVVNPGDIVAYPQPAISSICFLADMPSSGTLVIEVYNVAMQHVATFRENVVSPEYRSFCENLGPITSGAYTYKASLNGVIFPTRKFWVYR